MDVASHTTLNLDDYLNIGSFCYHEALWLDAASHVTRVNQSECIILYEIVSKARSYKEFSALIYERLIIKHSDWLKNLNSQSECLKMCVA